MCKGDNTAPLSTCQRLALAALSALLVYMASPALSLSIAAWCWIIPLIVATSELKPLRSALLFGLTAWCFWMASVWWLVPAIMQFAGVQLLVAAPLFALVCLLCALPYAVFGALLTKFNWLQQRLGVPLAAIAYTVVLSWIPSLIPGNPVHSLYQSPLSIQVLDLGGLPALIFANIFVQLAFAKSLLAYRRNKQWPLASLATGLLGLLLIFTYGTLRTEQIDTASTEGQSLQIGIVQPNLSRQDSIQPLFAMSESLAKANPKLDLLVWPEFPPAFSMIENPAQQESTLQLQQKIGIPMIVNSGYVYRRLDSGKRVPGYFNTNHLLNSGAIQTHYYKRILVPFFEYLPLNGYLQHWFPDSLNYIPGKKSTTFPLSNSIEIIPVICYEVIFPRAMHEFVDRGGNIIVNPVSDSWFGESTGSAHHFSLAMFRSVEYRIPFVRVANSGISAFVSASGKIIKSTDLNTQSALTATVFIPEQRSIYARWGDGFLYVISLIFIAHTLGRIWH